MKNQSIQSVCQQFRTNLLVLFLLVSSIVLAQKTEPKTDEKIDSEVVEIVKPFNPEITDAFKISETPSLDEDETKNIIPIEYSIFSVPVASTFEPTKGTALPVEKEDQPQFYKNYATLGLGNYGTLKTELFVNQDLGNSNQIGGFFRHLSSQGGINEVELDDFFYDTSLDLNYANRSQNLNWRVDSGYQNKIYNWYGLPNDFGTSLSQQERRGLIESINSRHHYNRFNIGGKIVLQEGFFKDASTQFIHFSDNFNSNENRFYLLPSFDVAVLEKNINTKMTLDFLEGKFQNNIQNTNTEPINYGFRNLGIEPSFALSENDLSVRLGASVFFSRNTQTNTNRMFFYPKIKASYKLVDNLMVFYTGIDGNLQQNSYADFVNENPFLSPTLNINPTNKQYDFFVGIKGKITNTTSYNLSTSFINEKVKALFKSQNFLEIQNNQDFAYGNALAVVYDDIKTIRFQGELKADISKDLNIEVQGSFYNYQTNLELEAWNLPTIELGLKANITLSEQWKAGTNMFFVGERKDQQFNLNPLINYIQNYTITLKSYFDLNAHVEYQYNKQLTAFLRLNNIANQNYQRWLNYPVQGFQILLGANYKFDF